MHFSTSFAAALAVAGTATATHKPAKDSVNPFLGKTYFVNPYYSNELNQTVAAFLAKNDTLNAARVRTVQKSIGTFVWIAGVSGLGLLNDTITEARKVQHHTGKQQIVQLVLYDLPDRDCSGGQSGGEFSSVNNGLELYKSTFIDPYAALVTKAKDLTFAVILEPDSLGNVITNQNVPFCANASAVYEEGIAYAIAKLQADNVHLYIDAAHGGWLGWDGNLPLGT
jgi:cellulose 1,4-beta-cellobiosidase